ncbi:MAG: T9SS type A sorting domain-containing protein [Ignavibacteria bacterium]|nr:T9SS type A sorting domain-containing protein [Ignavibacteria bacterium]
MKAKLLFVFASIFILIVFLFTSQNLYNYPNGITGRTQKTSTSGCGSCHGSGATTGLSVVITGPDSLAKGMSSSYTLTITSATGSKGGLDVAVRSGTLSTNQTGTQLLNSEIVHTTGKSFSGGSVSFTFNYTAPNINTTDTIFSTALSSTGGTGGQWNWSNKRVKVYTMTGVINNNEYQPSGYELKQNFPNPFNPVTSIVYSMKEAGNAELKVYDNTGKLISTLVNSFKERGQYKVDFNAGDIAGGIYYYSLKTKDFTETKQMVLVK